jgi:hypothetical protein
VTPPTPLSAADGAVLDAWWRAFVHTGRLPAELEFVQQRLVRAVHRGSLPSGPVYVKTMAFPRGKDRLRYLLRALPAAHEAAMLRAVAAAGLPCPAVVAVRTARRAGLPHRSMLVLRALPVDLQPEDPAGRLADEARLAAALLAAGIEHRDLHSGNFVRLQGGALAVLDVQSASLRGRPLAGRGARVAAAARLLRERLGGGTDIAGALRDGGLLHDDGELAAARHLAAAELQHYERGRIWRCFGESTEFCRTLHWWGVEHRFRGDRLPGRWLPRSPGGRQVWLGQRALQVFEDRPPFFLGFSRKWWWPKGAGSLYVSSDCCDERVRSEVSAASQGYERYLRL